MDIDIAIFQDLEKFVVGKFSIKLWKSVGF